MQTFGAIIVFLCFVWFVLVLIGAKCVAFTHVQLLNSRNSSLCRAVRFTVGSIETRLLWFQFSNKPGVVVLQAFIQS